MAHMSAWPTYADEWTFTVSMVMNDQCMDMAYPDVATATVDWASYGMTIEEGYTSTTNFYHYNEVLTRPIGECTTNVLGSSVIFTCEGDYINEHVYYDASQGPVPVEPDCSGDVMYVMPIMNTCNAYDWGSMEATWEGYCMASEPETSDCTDCVTQDQYDELYAMVEEQTRTIRSLQAEVDSLAGLEETVTEVDQAMTDMATCMAAYVMDDDEV